MGELVPWKCDECGGPVLAGAAVRPDQIGYLHIRKVDLGLHELATEQWSNDMDEWMRQQVEEHGMVLQGPEGAEVGMVLIDATYIAEHPPPPPVQWMVHHKQCDPLADSEDFVVGVSHVRTFAQLLRASVSMTQHDWVMGQTNWADFIWNLTEGN